MLFRGTVNSIKGEDYIVYILTDDDRTQQIDIDASDDIYFGEDPILIDTDIDDSFQTIICHECTINLVIKNYIGDLLFSKNARSTKVNVWKNDAQCIFAGFVEPNIYSLTFDSYYDEFTLNCIDALTSIQYYNYKNVLNKSDYDLKRRTASSRTFKDILLEILDFPHLDITLAEDNTDIMWDRSKKIGDNADERYDVDIFSGIGINDYIFYGEEFKDMMTQEEVLDNILTYMNMHIIQEGLIFKIFDWSSIKKRGNEINWTSINDYFEAPTEKNIIRLDVNDYRGSSVQIDMDDCYNQISLKCLLDEEEDVLHSMFDDDALRNVKPEWNYKQILCTEMFADGDGKTAKNSFINMVNGTATDYGNAHINDWYFHFKKPNGWDFSYYVNGTEYDAFEKIASYDYQEDASYFLKRRKLFPYVVSLGKYLRKQASDADNTIVNDKVSLDDYVVITVNGESCALTDNIYEQGQEQSDATTWENDINSYIGSNGLIRYSNAVSVNYTPVDEQITNYILLSGKIVLNGSFNKACASGLGISGLVEYYPRGWYETKNNGVRHTIPSDNNGDGRYYTRKWYKHPVGGNQAVINTMEEPYGILPFFDLESMRFEDTKYDYSNIGDQTDNIFMLPILECELKVYDPETGTTKYVGLNFEGSNTSNRPHYYWTPIATTFYLGINPAINDYIIGQEYDIFNNVDMTYGIEGEGTAIPITSNDHIKGQLSFKIIGPAHMTWNNIVRIHPSFWRHTRWEQHMIHVWRHVESIMIGKFECKIVSDQGKIEIDEDNDLVYASNEINDYINKKEDIEFRFATAITLKEASLYGITNLLNKNYVLDMRQWHSDDYLRSLYEVFTNEQDKPEKLYINQYYNEYSKPRLMVEVELEDRPEYELYDIYYMPILDKMFYIRSYSFDVKNDKKKYKMKEIEDMYVRPKHKITLYADEDKGEAVSSIEEMEEGQQTYIEAVPNEGYEFSEWSDGNATNPRLITMGTTDINLEAVFINI